MIGKIKRKLNHQKEKVFYKLLLKTLQDNNVDLYIRDSRGMLIKRLPTDNFQYIFKTGFSCDAEPMMEALDNKLNNLGVGLDIGANIGITTLWMARNCTKVYAFEPEKDNLSRLHENIQLNNADNIEVIPYAVSDSEGDAELNILEGYGHHSLGKVNTSKFIRAETVKTITLDKFCAERNIEKVDFLKVDVEGFEIEVLKGAEQLFKNKKVGLLAFEVSKVPLQSLNKSPFEVYDFLSNHNYAVLDLLSNPIDRSMLSQVDHVDLIAVPQT